MKNCYDCKNLRCKTPIIDGELLYNQAKAYCKYGLLQNAQGKPRVFNSTERKLLVYEYGQFCSEFESMEDEIDEK